MEQTLLLAAVFATVVLSVVGAGMLLRDRGIDRRLAGSTTGTAPSPKLAFNPTSPIVQLALKAGAAKADEQTRGKLRRQLAQAGYLGPNAPSIYLGMRVLLSLSLPLVGLLVSSFVASTMTYEDSLMVMVGLGLLGYLLPSLYVGRVVKTRQRLAREGFPDALDMLVVCVEAGLGIDAAIQKVGDEIVRGHPLLSWHFRLMGLELRAGKGREDALRHFADRIGIDEVSALVGLLIQTERLGTSMAQALKAYSDDMRARRMLRAEEKAQKLGVLMSLPLIGFILPALVIAILSPAFIRAAEEVLPMFFN